ncbi:MFS transporter [Candidatus Poribacteria bacterium]|nr:MFS transporter [Candidatus Poribacteria bacterium]
MNYHQKNIFVAKKSLIKNNLAYVPALLMDISLTCAYTSIAFHAKYLGISSTILGAIIASGGAFFVFLSVPFGRISDRVGRTRMLYVACILVGFVNLLIPFFYQDALSIALMVPIIGISQALFWPIYEAWLAERIGGGDLLRRIRTFNLFWTVGVTLGPFIAGNIYEMSHTLPFYITVTASVINLIIIISQSNTSLRNKNVNDKSEDTESRDETVSVSPETRRMYLYIAWIANFASWFTLGILRNLAPKLMLQMGIRERTFGNLMLVNGLSQLLMFLFLGTPYPRRWHYKLSPLLAFQAVGVIAFLGIWGVTNIPLWALAFFVIGTTSGMTYFCSIYYSLHGHVDKGAKSGFHEAILGSGALLGPFLGGVLADLLGLKSPYFLCAVVIVISMIAQKCVLQFLYVDNFS